MSSKSVQRDQFTISPRGITHNPTGATYTPHPGAPSCGITTLSRHGKLLPDGEPVQLTHDRTDKMTPAFTPPGDHVTYGVTALMNNPQDWSTWSVPVFGGEPRLLLSNASALTTSRRRGIVVFISCACQNPSRTNDCGPRERTAARARKTAAYLIDVLSAVGDPVSG